MQKRQEVLKKTRCQKSLWKTWSASLRRYIAPSARASVYTQKMELSVRNYSAPPSGLAADDHPDRIAKSAHLQRLAAEHSWADRPGAHRGPQSGIRMKARWPRGPGGVPPRSRQRSISSRLNRQSLLSNVATFSQTVEDEACTSAFWLIGKTTSAGRSSSKRGEARRRRDPAASGHGFARIPPVSRFPSGLVSSLALPHP